MADAHLKNGNLIIVLQTEDCKRKPDVVIEISVRLQCLVLYGKNRGNDFLRTCLSDRSRDPDHRDSQLPAIKARNFQKGVVRRFYKNIGIFAGRFPLFPSA